MSDKKLRVITCNDCRNTYKETYYTTDNKCKFVIYKCCELCREIDLDGMPDDCPLEDYRVITMIIINTGLKICKHQKVAVIQIQNTEIGRLCFDDYTDDGKSVVFFIDGKDVINIDYDELVEL